MVVLGVAVGLVVGYVLMGTAHAVSTEPLPGAPAAGRPLPASASAS